MKILVIDDNRVVLEGICNMLKSQRDFAVSSSVATNNRIITEIRQNTPDVILLDIDYKGRTAYKIVQLLQKDLPHIKIIIMVFSPAKDNIFRFVETGVSGFVHKDAVAKVFISTIKAVYKGKKVFPQYLTNSLFAQIVENINGDSEIPKREAIKFNQLERNILKLISQSITNREIGMELKLSPEKVKSTIQSIMQKIELSNRLDH